MTDTVWADSLPDEMMDDYIVRLSLDKAAIETTYGTTAAQPASSYIVRAKAKDKQQHAPPKPTQTQ